MIFSPLFSLRRRARLAVRSSVAVVAALLSLALGTTAFAADAATASIAPFVNKDTLAVVRVNFENVDVDRLAETLDGIVANALQNAGYDAASVEKVGAELDKTFAALAEDGKTQLAELRETVLPTEAFFVVQTAKGEGAALLVPLENASESKRQLLTNAAKLAGQSRGFASAVYQNRWLVVASDLKAFGRYYKNFKPGSNRQIETFFQQNDAALVAGYCGTLRLRPFLDAATDGQSQALVSQFSRPARDALEVFDANFVSAQCVVDAGTLVSRATLRFNAPIAAGNFLTALQGVVDETAKELYASPAPLMNGLISEKYAKEFKLTPLARELWRGRVRSRLPKQNGAELVCEYDVAKEAAQAAGAPALALGRLLLVAQNLQAAQANASTDGEIDFEFDEAPADETPADETPAAK